MGTEMVYRGFRILVVTEGGYNHTFRWEIYTERDDVLVRSGLLTYGLDNPPTYLALSDAREWIDDHHTRIKRIILTTVNRIEHERNRKEI